MNFTNSELSAIIDVIEEYYDLTISVGIDEEREEFRLKLFAIADRIADFLKV